MAVFKCKMCGANLEVSENQSVVTCEYCSTQQTLPKFDDDRKITLFTRSNHLRFNCEFDKAAGVYESIVTEFPDEAEAYWGLVLCKYGIEYVDDKYGSKIPTCHRTLPTSIMDDEDFTLACDYADINSKSVYRNEAKAIDAIQKKILQIAATEKPYDIFICYKETDDNTGARTEDSSIAQDIYTQLIKDGYKVFFSRVTLREVAGTEYEPYIYAALSSAKVMLAIGTRYEYYDAVWVKNEWSRFISMMGDDSSKALIPCYRNMDAYDMPKEFKNMQALDMGEVTFFASLSTNINRLLPKVKAVVKESVAADNGTGASVDSLLKRAFMFLEDGDWNNANIYCEKVLDIDPENAQAYLGKLMVDLRISKYNDLGKVDKSFDNNANFIKAYRFADEKLKSELGEYIKHIKLNIAETLYRKVLSLYETSEDTSVLFSIAGDLKQISGYKDANELAEKCRAKAENISRIKEIERIENEKESIRIKEERTRHYKKIAKIGIPIVAVMVVFTIVLTIVIIPKVKFKDIVAISTGSSYSVALKSDGEVVAVGDNGFGQCDVDDWRDIVAISAGYNHTVGLKSDGTVVAVGDNRDGNCNVSEWSDIIAVSAGTDHTVGLKSDGTVVSTVVPDFADEGQTDVSEWTDIIAVSAGDYHTVGLKSDGTVVAVGGNVEGSCDVENWSDIVAISAGSGCTFGLKSDGTVVATGQNNDGNCNVSEWTDIVAISAYSGHTVGLKSDGTVVAVGFNSAGSCDVENWTNIVAISTNMNHTVGLKSDGTVVAVGDNGSGECLVGGKK